MFVWKKTKTDIAIFLNKYLSCRRETVRALKSVEILSAAAQLAGRFFGLVTKHACDGQTVRQTELRLPRPR